MLSTEKFGGYKTEVKEQIERQALRNKVKEEKHLETYRELREDIGIETQSERPNGQREKAETAISCRGPVDLP